MTVIPPLEGGKVSIELIGGPADGRLFAITASQFAVASCSGWRMPVPPVVDYRDDMGETPISYALAHYRPRPFPGGALGHVKRGAFPFDYDGTW